MSKSDLIRQLQMANQAYAQGNPYLSEEEYHKLWKSLRDIDPQNPELFHTSKNPNLPGKISHSQRILSLNKAMDSHDLKVFLQRFRDVPEFLIQPKYDGVALMLYNNPSGFQAVLVGDGDSGDDISWIIPEVKQIPDISDSPYISCEALILWQDWDTSLGKNPRNTVSGLLNPSRLQIGTGSERITLIPHDYHSERIDLNSLSYDDIQTKLLEIYHSLYKIYPLDGLVIKVPDSNRRLAAGHNGLYPHWAIAWKPPIQRAKTSVREIHWNVSRAGRLIPQIEYNPVDLCGTTNSFVTANNAEWLKIRGITPESQLVIGKAGEIIPQILEIWNSGNPELPSICPVCESPLSWSGVHLVCESPDCWPQLVKNLAHFYGHFGMDLKSIGEALLSDLLENLELYEVLRSSVWALLDPETFGILGILRSIWGTAITENYLDSLSEINSSKDMAHFVSGLGYPKLGYKNALKLFQFHLDYDVSAPKDSQVWDSFRSALDDLSRAKSELPRFKFSPIPKPPSVTYCITGTLPFERNEVISELSAYGWKHINSVSKNLDYLVLGDLDKETTKLKKAKSLGIKIIYPEDLPNFHFQNF